MLPIILLIFTLWSSIRTISYGIYEINKNNNTSGGIAVIIIALLAVILPNAMVWINGFY